MTTINGVYHHNVEDILASIRTSIADEAGATRLVSGEIHMPTHHPFLARRDAPPSADEAAEFELPAIFKPGHHAAVERPKLFGRLSEALKTNAPHDAGRARTVIPFDPSSANGAANGATSGRMIEPPAALQMAATSNEPKHFRPQYNAQPEPAKQHVDEVARVMPSFFDTRLNKLGEMSREVYKPKAPEPAPQPQLAPAPVYRQPPTLPQGNLGNLGDLAQQHTNSAVDDAAAQLLRPMLRQWLQENMPKIVEKALLSEAQGDFSPPNPNDPNKPQR